MSADSRNIPGFEVFDDGDGDFVFEYPIPEYENPVKIAVGERILRAFLDGKTLSNISTIILYQHCVLSKIKLPEGLEERYQIAVSSGELSTQGWIENYLFSEIQSLFPDAQSNIFIDGFEIDIFIPSLGAIIESDNPKKYRHRYKYLQKRDNYLYNTYGYTTTRFTSLYNETNKSDRSKSEILKDDVSKLVTFLMHMGNK